MILKHIPCFWVFLCCCSFLYSQEIAGPSFGKGLLNISGKDSTWTMKVGLRFQTLGSVSWEKAPQGGLGNPESNMLIRRSRLKFDGFAFTPDLGYKFEVGLANRDQSGSSEFTGNAPRYIMDAVLMWRFYRNFELWLGQTKLPGNIERVISSANLQQVDRSLLNRLFNIDRDMGIQLRHQHYLSEKLLIREKIAFSQGEGRNVTTGNQGGHQYTARLEVLPFGEFTSDGDYSGADLAREPHPKLMLAATYDTNQDAVRTRSNLGPYMVTDTGLYESTIETLFVDAMLKYAGFSLMAEYALRDAGDPVAVNSDGTPTGDVVLIGEGINLQAGYLLESNWEVSGRYTHVAPDGPVTGETPETQYTFGISRYLAGHKLKVQTDLSYLDAGPKPDELMYRLQVEIHF